MKAKWLFASAVAVLASCEKPAPVAADEPPRKMPLPTKIEETPPASASSPAPERSPSPAVAEAPPPPKQDPAAPPNPQPPPRPGPPEAQAVPNQPGFVFSPYNNKIIDVRELPSGTLVADPTYPADAKKFFRVP